MPAKFPPPAGRGRMYGRRVSVDLGPHYQARQAELDRSLAVLGERSDKLSQQRGILMLALIAALITSWIKGWPVWGLSIAGVLGAGFIGLVVRHALVASERTLCEERQRWVRAARVRMGLEPAEKDAKQSKKAAAVDAFGARFEKPEHPYSGDLDLFGERSLFAAASRAETSIGEETFAKWLTKPGTLEEIRARQEAAQELCKRPRLLEDVAILARRAESRGRAEEPLTVWGEAPAELPVGAGADPKLAARGTLIWIARLLVPLTVTLFFTRPLLLPLGKLGSYAYAGSLTAQVIVLGLLYGPISRMITFVSSRESPFGRFRTLFTLIEEAPAFESALLRRVVAALKREGEPQASLEIARLERVVGFADLRHNVIVHTLVNLLFLYDLWVGLALERWRARSGKRVRGWLTAVGELEAICSVATFAGEHPDFAWPEMVEGAPTLAAEDLGHPLIAPGVRVTNPASLAATNEASTLALLVTGSNMSGKSTYLRSLGLCAVMAAAGMPVCAKSARLSVLRVWTSMRIADALEKGMSHFYAELLRLKEIVKDAQGGAHVLFLLDEILHGTNSHERTIGARGVVLDLIDRGAIGAVSTHDFALVGIAEESAGRVRTVHFSDRVEGDKMLFDYRMHEGVVETTNAIRLMKAVGIDVAYGER